MNLGCALSGEKNDNQERSTPMKLPEATPATSVKETEANVQEEIWRFIANILKRGLKCLLEGLS